MSTFLPWRTFSIFISSTFADMQAERDYLKNKVFPLVEEELQKRRIKLEIVDLRWGVETSSISQEDEREANVLKVCLDEIRRCRPFFIGLLGDRYGWVPPEERMKAAVIDEALIIPEKGRSVTDLEIEFGVLASQEQLVRSVFYFRNPIPYENFPDEKKALFSDAHNPELSEVEKTERKTALENLKTRIRQHFDKKKMGDKVKTYSAIWEESTCKVTGLEAWGEVVYNDILAECEIHAAETWDQVPQDWQEQEMALLDAFVETQIQTFCGRKSLLEELKRHLLTVDTANWGLILTGESGSGKSAVFAMIYKMMQQEDCCILAHSAGLSPRANHVTDLLQIWNKRLSNELGVMDVKNEEAGQFGEPKTNLGGEAKKVSDIRIEKLQQKFTELLQMVPANKLVLLLIDALDRFEPTARAQHLSWLPAPMPQNVRLLCTAVAGTEQKAVQYHNGLSVKSIDMFSTQEAKEMLFALCKKQHKTLSPKVESILLGKKRDDRQYSTSNPLWLSLAVNILMAIDQDDFEKMSRLEGRGDQKIEAYLIRMSTTFDPLPGPLFLSLVEKAGDVFGKAFCRAVFDHIAISRKGLREKDLEKLLPENTWNPLQFAGLRRWFKAHLVLQGEEMQWNLAHNILRHTLTEKLNSAKLKQLHYTISDHLRSLPGTDSLQISETMYHLMQAGDQEIAAIWYGSFWWDEPQTEGSSKIIADALIQDEAKGKTEWMEWVIPLLEHGDNEKLNPRTVSANFMVSLYDKYLQNDINIQNRIRIVQAAEHRMKKLSRRFPDSAEYALDLSASYGRLGDLYNQSGNLPTAIDKYQASLAITEELHRRDPGYAVYAKDLSASYDRLGDLYLDALGDLPKALEKYQASLTNREELYHRAPGSMDFAINLCLSYERLGSLYLKLGYHSKAIDMYQASLTLGEELHRRNPDSELYARNLMIMYGKSGDLYLKLDDSHKALEMYQVSLTLGEELHRQVPDSAEYATDLLIIYGKIGDLCFRLGNLSQTLDYYQASLTLSEVLCRRVPDSADYRRNLSISYDRLGDLYLKQGDYPQALEKYEASLNIREKLIRQAPDSADYASKLSGSYNNLGNLYLKTGDSSKALDNYQVSLTIDEELRRRVPESAEFAEKLLISYSKIGDLYLQLGNHLKALTKYQASLTLAEELCLRAPDSAEYKRDLSISYERLGNLYITLNDPPHALDMYKASLAHWEELHGRNPDSAEYAMNVYLSHFSLGDLYLRMGDPHKAFEKFKTSVIMAEELRRRDPGSIDYALNLAISFNRLGDLYLQLNDPPIALEKYLASLTIRENLCSQHPESLDYSRGLTILYGRLGGLYLQLNNPPKALEKYLASMTTGEELRRRDPDSEDFAMILSITYSRLGDLYLRLGHIPKAYDKFKASLAIREELRRRNPDSPDYARDLVESYYNFSVICQQNNDEEGTDKYIRLLKDVLMYMQKHNMHMDKSLVNLLNQLNQF